MAEKNGDKRGERTDGKGTPQGTRFLLEGIVVTVVFASYRKFTQIIPEHAHGENVYEVHFVTEGEGRVRLNRQEYALLPGTLYITGPEVLHEQISEEQMPVTEFGMYLQLESGAGGELVQYLRKQPLWYGTGRTALLPLAERILTEQMARKPGGTEMLSHLLAEFLIECIRSMKIGTKEEQGFPVPEEKFTVHKIQEENMLLVADEMFLYEYRDITVEKLAERLGLSVRQTQRYLEKSYGKTFTQKKLEARMSAAAIFLQNGKYSITEISELLGYSSVEHFSYAFSKYYGCVPSSYRKKTNVR